MYVHFEGQHNKPRKQTIKSHSKKKNPFKWEASAAQARTVTFWCQKKHLKNSIKKHKLLRIKLTDIWGVGGSGGNCFAKNSPLLYTQKTFLTCFGDFGQELIYIFLTKNDRP